MNDWYKDLLNPNSVEGVILLGLIGTGLWQLLRYGWSLAVGHSTKSYLTFRQWRRRVLRLDYRIWLINPEFALQRYIFTLVVMVASYILSVQMVIIRHITPSTDLVMRGFGVLLFAIAAHHSIEFYKVSHFFNLTARHRIRSYYAKRRKRLLHLLWARVSSPLPNQSGGQPDHQHDQNDHD